MNRVTPTDWTTQEKIFKKFGCIFIRQKGDHLIFHHPEARRPIVIPKYDEVPVTIIRINMKTVGMSREKYFEILSKL